MGCGSIRLARIGPGSRTGTELGSCDGSPTAADFGPTNQLEVQSNSMDQFQEAELYFLERADTASDLSVSQENELSRQPGPRSVDVTGSTWMEVVVRRRMREWRRQAVRFIRQ